MFETDSFLSEICFITDPKNSDARLTFWGSPAESSVYSIYHNKSPSFFSFTALLQNSPHYKAFKEARYNADPQIASLEFHCLFSDPNTLTIEYFFSDPFSDFLEIVPPLDPSLKSSLNADRLHEILSCHAMFPQLFASQAIHLLTKG